MKIISIKEMRRLEAAAMAAGVSGRELMRLAGEHSAEEMLQLAARFASGGRFVILTGKGNNGGDGWVVARTLHEAGRRVLLFSVCDRAALPPDARWHAERLPTGVPWRIIENAEELRRTLGPRDVIVDALLGTGVVGGPRGLAAALAEAINDSGLPVVSLDVPSGLDADTGEGRGAVRADWTLTMGFPKTGLFLKDGASLSGRMRVIDIGLPQELIANSLPSGPDESPRFFSHVADGCDAVDSSFCLEAFALQDARMLLPYREPTGHKNTFGHLLCLCNSSEYSGAGELCAVAALRMGAGLVTLAVPDESHFREGPAALIHKSLHGKSFSLENLPQLEGLLGGKSAMVYGPGTGRDVDSAFLKGLLERRLPMVIDADGLRLLAANPQLLNDEDERCRLVLTPHPGEMRALLDGFGLSELLDAPRAMQARELSALTKCVIVLKGRHTVVADPSGRVTLNLSGDVSLATAGSGDVLSGCIGALLAEGLATADAARLGVFLHGLAAELRMSPARSLIADDLPALLAEAIEVIGGRASI